jgi:UPF0716 protein FxsA
MPLLLLLAWPFAEIGVYIKIGAQIGAGNVILAILGTGFLGMVVLRYQGFKAFNSMRADLARGALPTDSLLDSVLLFGAGVLLILPGLITDALGLLLLLSPTRWFIRYFFKGRITGIFQTGQFSSFTFTTQGRGKSKSQVIDIEANPKNIEN